MKMNPVRILTFLSLTLCSALPAAAKPNIIAIMADDMGFECMSSNGRTSYQTPHLDRLAKGGIRFTHAHSQPICTPSRVQLMTGIYNNRNYLKFGFLDPASTTFAQLMKKAGYATCVAGKWQLEGGLQGPTNFGFDEYCLWQLTRRPSRYANPGLEVNGKLKDYRKGEYGPDLVSDFICEFIERKKDAPFFVYYPMILPHWPFEPTPDSPDYDKTAKGGKGQAQPKYFKDMVSYTDKIVGKIDTKLDSLGLREDTLLLFIGDNGTATSVTSQLNGKPYRGGKGSPRDNGTHVPMVASWPGTVPKGHVSSTLVDLSDWLPTICELGGAKVPKQLGLRGVSFAPLLKGNTEFKGRDHIYCWYERNGKREKASQHTRNRRYKLYADEKFYDVTRDPDEKNPLPINTLSEEVLAHYKKLKASLDAELAITEASAAHIAARLTALKGAKRTSNKKPTKKTLK